MKNFMLWAVLFAGVSACASDAGRENRDSGLGETNSDSDTDADSDSDTDADTDTDSDTDSKSWMMKAL